MHISAVITADIVNSTLLVPKQERKLRTAIETIFLDQKIEFYRGDSFQSYCKDPGLAYDLILMARATARSFSEQTDIRAGIGIGEIKLPVRFLNTSSSEAFILSGRAFDALGEAAQRLNIVALNERNSLAFNIISNYTDFIFERMTAPQAEVVFHLLFGKTQKEIAKKLKKAQPTIAKHAKAAGWSELERLSDQYKKAISELT